MESQATVGVGRSAAGKRTATLAGDATMELRRLIVSNILRSGDPLSEPVLAARLGTSRSPIREALRQLAAEGLVMLRPNRVAIVARLDPVALHQLFEVEAALESYAAEQAAARLGGTDRARLEQLQASLEQAHECGNVSRYAELNRQFHAAVVAAAGNAALSALHERIIRQLQRARNAALSRAGRADESIAEHRAILAALIDGRCQDARQAVVEHILHTDEAIARLETAGGDLGEGARHRP